MQRHRDERIGLGEEFTSRLAEPAAHHRREIKPVTIFEGMDQSARNLIEAHRGAGAMVGGRIGNGFHRQNAWPGIVYKWSTKPLAKGPGDEGQLRPARRTQAAALDRFAAGRAERRQSEIEHAAQC